MTKQNEFDGLTALHRQETDPGTAWKRDETVAIGVNPLSPRSGALTPNVITLREGGYRMYYTGFAPGLTPANIGGHVLSAFSHDATVWTTETRCPSGRSPAPCLSGGPVPRRHSAARRRVPHVL